MAMCEGCRSAADSGDMSLHCSDPSCTCQHNPLTDSRIVRAQRVVDMGDTATPNASLEDSPANHSHAGDTPTPVHRERQTF